MANLPNEPKIDRYTQSERWLSEGLDKLGDGIAWAGFWIGLGLLGVDFLKWVVTL